MALTFAAAAPLLVAAPRVAGLAAPPPLVAAAPPRAAGALAAGAPVRDFPAEAPLPLAAAPRYKIKWTWIKKNF